MATPPARISVQSIAKSNRLPAASTTRRAASTTSGPTPSPGIAATRYVVVMPPSTGFRHARSEAEGGAPRRHSPEEGRPPSWEPFARVLARERHVDAVDLRPMKLVG